MSLRSRFEKLEPRERRLLTILSAFFGAAIFLVIPIAIVTVVAGKRNDNDELRALVDSIYEARAQVGERKAVRDALLSRYAKPAPPLAGFLDEAAKANGITAAESQDKPPAPHGKHYTERLTALKMHKIGLVALAKMLEKIEQSGYPVTVSKLTIKPRSGEPDMYEVELGVSAFDRKNDAPPAGAASSAHSPTAPPATTSGTEEDE